MGEVGDVIWRSHQGRTDDDDDGNINALNADGKSLLKIHSLICAKEIKCLSPEDNSEHVMKVSAVNLEGTISPTN